MRVRSRNLLSAIVLVLAALSSLAGPTVAAPKLASDIWDTYMDAAAKAVMDDEPRSAKLLWQCAVQVAQQMHDDDRLLLSHMMLFITAWQLNDKATMDAVRPEIKKFDVKHLDESLLPASRTLATLGGHYDDEAARVSRQAKPKTENEKKELDEEHDRLLKSAVRCYLMAWAIQKNPKVRSQLDANSLAENLAEYGMVLRHDQELHDARQQLEDALDIWNKEEQSAAKVAQASETFSVRAGDRSGTQAMPITAVYAVTLLADAYFQLGNSSEEKADVRDHDLRQSEQLYNKALKTIEPVWPRIRIVATLHDHLGLLYSEEKNYSQAESHLANSLALFDALTGRGSDDSNAVAHSLAETYRDDNKEPKARQLERAYNLSTPAPQ